LEKNSLPSRAQGRKVLGMAFNISRREILDNLAAREKTNGHKKLWTRKPAILRAIEAAEWRTPSDVRKTFGAADFVGDLIVIDICGNDYRLVIKVNCDAKAVEFRWAGNHDEYNEVKIKAP